MLPFLSSSFPDISALLLLYPKTPIDRHGNGKKDSLLSKRSKLDYVRKDLLVNFGISSIKLPRYFMFLFVVCSSSIRKLNTQEDLQKGQFSWRIVFLFSCQFSAFFCYLFNIHEKITTFFGKKWRKFKEQNNTFFLLKRKFPRYQSTHFWFSPTDVFFA